MDMICMCVVCDIRVISLFYSNPASNSLRHPFLWLTARGNGADSIISLAMPTLQITLYLL